MKLTVLGGSAAGPNPGQGCSGYLVASGQTHVVLDLGPGTLPELRRHTDFRELSGVVLSHLHLDHLLDVLALRFALAYNPVRPGARLPLWLPPGGEAFLRALARAFAEPDAAEHFFNVFDAKEYDPDRPLHIAAITIRFHPTVHFVPCWAMRVADGLSGDLFYSADTGPAANLVPFARGAFVVLAEGTEGDPVIEPIEERGHLTPREAGELARKVGAALLVLTHLWAEHDPFSALAEARLAFPGEILQATAGLQITW